MATKLMAKISALSAGLKDFNDGVKRIRTQIGELNVRAMEISDAKRPQEEAIADLDAWLDKAADEAARGFTGSLSAASGSAFQGVEIPSPRGHWFMFIATCREQVRAYMMERITSLYADGPGLSAEERQKALDGIDSVRLKLEMTEEALIRAAEAEGIVIGRRDDADPKAVLASDSFLASHE